MSTTPIGKILREAGGPSGAEKQKIAAKETKQKTEEIVKELVNDAQQQPKRGPGRPPKSQSPGRPKTPPAHSAMPEAPNPNTGKPAEAIRNQLLVRRMNLYVRKFPEYAVFFEGYNPILHTPDENQKILDAFLELIHTEIEFATAPAAITGIVTGLEDAATAWAIKNPEHPGAQVVEELSGVSEAILRDKAVSLDVRLLECEVSGYLPKNPKLRLILNVGRSILQYWSRNRLNTVTPPKNNSQESGPPPGPQNDSFKKL